MKLSKFLIASLVVTFFSVLYVWQQTAIFKLAYSGQRSNASFEDLLDKNSALRYNLKKNTSLTRMGERVLESNDFQMPDSYCLVKLSSPKESQKYAKNRAPKRENLAYRIFGIKREAEARTINH
jgi:hypothetical protein